MELPALRLPAVAGRFYPSASAALIAAISAFENQDPPPCRIFQNAVACIAPHAGYMYSGSVASAVYSRLPARSRYIVLGPNHVGRGQQLAALSSDWLTPLGSVTVDRTFIAALLRECEAMADDPVAHAAEHSLEVQLPFLQYFAKEFTLVPIAIGAVEYGALEALGQTLARLVQSTGSPTLLVASSDLNHYEPEAVTRIKDHKAIDRILALDAPGLAGVLNREHISMCGFAPVIAVLTAARSLGATKGELVKYTTSADAGGDPSAVVGYAGIVIH